MSEVVCNFPNVVAHFAGHTHHFECVQSEWDFKSSSGERGNTGGDKGTSQSGSQAAGWKLRKEGDIKKAANSGNHDGNAATSNNSTTNDDSKPNSPTSSTLGFSMHHLTFPSPILAPVGSDCFGHMTLEVAGGIVPTIRHHGYGTKSFVLTKRGVFGGGEGEDSLKSGESVNKAQSGENKEQLQGGKDKEQEAKDLLDVEESDDNGQDSGKGPLSSEEKVDEIQDRILREATAAGIKVYRLD
jgi:hypothetical protein